MLTPELRKRIESCNNLPSPPGVATKIIRLANDPDAEQCLRLSPPFDPANASHAHDWAQQVEDHYNAFVADAQRRGLEARYDCALEIDSWHILQPLRPFGGAGNWR